MCLFSTACGTNLPLLLTQHTGATGTKGAGIGGILTIGGTSPIRISIEAAPWTLKTKTSIDQITTPVGGTVKKFVNRTEKGFVHGARRTALRRRLARRASFRRSLRCRW